MQRKRRDLWGVITVLLPVMFSCGEPPFVKPTPAATPTAGQVLSGLAAYEENWRDARWMADRGDSTGLRTLRALLFENQKLIGQFDRQASAVAVIQPPDGSQPTTIYGSGNAEIYSSDTWPSA